MSIISEKDYQRAKEYIEMLETAIVNSHERIMELIDDLAGERTTYETYKHAIEYNKELIMEYEKKREVYSEDDSKGDCR